MYVPKHFAMEDHAARVEFMRRHDFAMLVTPGPDGIAVTHLPLLVASDAAGAPVLRGHVARANPHWRLFDATDATDAAAGGAESLAVFAGPHGYVSPAWYGEPPAPPTWNYAVVHAHGRPRRLDSTEALSALLDELVATSEASLGAPWARDLPAPLRAGMLKAIVGFEMAVERLEAKFKLSQNRPAADQERVAASLAAQGSPALAALMREHLGLAASD